MKDFIIAPSRWYINRLEADFIIGEYSVYIDGCNTRFFEEELFIDFSDSLLGSKNKVTDVKCSVSLSINGQTRFCADKLNNHPFYYFVHGRNIVLTSNLFLLKKLNINLEIDPVGLIQRLSGPDFTSFGERTLLKNIKKTLPFKEYIFNNGKVNSTELSIIEYGMQKASDSVVDNLLDVLFDSHREVLSGFNNIDIALSGGLDSRLSLGIFYELLKEESFKSKKIRSITYGSCWNYESRLAETLAYNLSLPHIGIWDDLACWPTCDELFSYAQKSNSIGISSWNNLIRFYKIHVPKRDQCLVMGDLLEAVAGRKLQFGLSRTDKIKAYFKSSSNQVLKSIDLDLLSDSISTEIVKNLIEVYSEIGAFKDLKGLKLSEVIDESRNDLKAIYEVCRRMSPLTKSQFYESFQWLIYSSPDYRNQAGYFKGIIHCFSPSTSIEVLGRIINIDPIHRLNGKLLLLLMKSINCFPAMDIPIASSPYVKISYPDFLRKLSNLIRVFVDAYYKSRRMADKNYLASARFLKDTNWVKVHRLFPFAEYDELIGEDLFDYPMRIVETRSKLKSQPLVNYDLVNWIFVSYMSRLLVKK